MRAAHHMLHFQRVGFFVCCDCSFMLLAEGLSRRPAFSARALDRDGLLDLESDALLCFGATPTGRLSKEVPADATRVVRPWHAVAPTAARLKGRNFCTAG